MRSTPRARASGTSSPAARRGRRLSPRSRRSSTSSRTRSSARSTGSSTSSSAPASSAPRSLRTMPRGWLLRLDPARSTLELDVGEAAASATSEPGVTVVATGRVYLDEVIRTYRRTGTLESPEAAAAVALYDASDRVLVLARDRTGRAPLVYADTVGGGIVASSDPRAVTAHADVPRDPA